MSVILTLLGILESVKTTLSIRAHL